MMAQAPPDGSFVFLPRRAPVLRPLPGGRPRRGAPPKPNCAARARSAPKSRARVFWNDFSCCSTSALIILRNALSTDISGLAPSKGAPPRSSGTLPQGAVHLKTWVFEEFLALVIGCILQFSSKQELLRTTGVAPGPRLTHPWRSLCGGP